MKLLRYLLVGGLVSVAFAATSLVPTSDHPVWDSFSGKTWQERANIASREIAKVNSVGSFVDRFSGNRIEILSVSKIDLGVEVMARAWDASGSRLGFGADGSVEIERFKIFNPSILVHDQSGSIVRNFSVDGKWFRLAQREDLRTALREQLAAAIRVTGIRHANVQIGKVGHTTATFNPASGANTPVDGYVGRDTPDESFSAKRTGAGDVADSTVDIGGNCLRLNPSSNPNYNRGDKGIFGFPTSTLGAGVTISSATLTIYGFSSQSGLSQSMVIDHVVPASSSSLAASDYNIASWDSIEQASNRIATSAWDTSGAGNVFTLNATGRGNINKTGNTWFGTVTSGFFDNSAPSWSATAAQATCYFADAGSSLPTLTVTYSATAKPLRGAFY